MAGAGIEAAAEPGAAGEAVHPGGRVFPTVRAFRVEAEEIGERVEADVLGLEREAGDPAQPERRRKDQPGEAEAAERRDKETGILRPGADEPSRVAAGEFDRLDMTAETALAMRVLAVYIVGDRPADRDEARAGHHRQEPARPVRRRPGEHGEDLGESDARLAGEEPGFGIEGDEAVEPAHRDERPARIERHVAIGPAITVREQAARRAARDHRGGAVAGRRAEDGMCDAEPVAPGGEDGAARHSQAIRRRTPQTTPSQREKPSFRAKSTGSSFIRPCTVRCQTRRLHKRITGISPQSISGRR